MKRHLYFGVTLAGLLMLPALLAAPAFAQSAAELEALLSTSAVSYEEAAWFVLRAAEVPGLGGPEEAFGFAAERKWLPAGAAPGDRARLDGVSLLFMQSFGLKGGLFYSGTKHPHYAYRELVYQGIIQGRADPQMAVSGDFLLFIMGNVLSRGEGE